MVLTTEGARFHEEVSALFAGLQRATAHLTRKLEWSAIKLRAPHTVAMRWLLPRVSAYQQHNPNMSVTLHTSLSPLDFEREDIDVGVAYGNGQWPGLHACRLMPNVLVPVCAPTLLDKLQRPEDLWKERLLHSLARPHDWHAWLAAARLSKAHFAGGLRFESSALAYEAALEGYGVAIAQKALVERELQEGRLVMPFELALDMHETTYYLVYPSHLHEKRSEQIRSFCAQLT